MWHQRLVHTSVDTIKFLHKTVEAFPGFKETLETFHPCHMGNSKKKSFQSDFEDGAFPGEIFHSDLSVKLLKINNDNRYYCTFTDQLSRYVHVAEI